MKCEYCGEDILLRQESRPIGTMNGPGRMHVECGLRMVVGGIGHLEDHEFWCLTMHDPDGGRTDRESSIQVWAWVREHGVP